MKRLLTCLLLPLFITACGSDDESDFEVAVALGDITKGVASMTVTVTSAGDVTPQGNITVTPTMYMDSGMVHSTPMESNTGELDENGSFTTTAYFLMASMGGNWEVDIKYNDTVTSHEIIVDMLMSDRKVLKGDATDLVPHLESEVNRSYYLFDQGRKVSDAMNMFSVYIAARETLMEYQAVTDGAILNAGTSYELTLGTVTVEMCSSTCDDESNWQTAIEDSENSGHYTSSSLTLSNDENDSVEVRLNIGGDQKTSDGTDAGNNATFTFTSTDSAMSM